MAARLTLVAIALAVLVFVALQAVGVGSATTEIRSASLAPAPAPRASLTIQETAASQVEDGTVSMTLLHNNDGESKLLPDRQAGFPGIARFVDTWIDRGRATDADILLRVSSGDNFLASKEFSAGLAREDNSLYDSLALRGLYEVMGLGNHDFDFGPEITARFVNDFLPELPFVAANIDVSDEPAMQDLVDQGRLAPSTVVTDPSSGFDVGVIGVVTPRLANISSPRDLAVDADLVGAITEQVEALQADGIDRIVLISHLQGLSEDRELVPQLSGVDIVVAGGGDELLKNDGDTCQPDEDAVGDYPLILADADGLDVPVVTAPGGYRCIGELNVTFDADGEIMSMSGSSIGVPLDGDPEPYAKENVEEPLTEALAELEATVIGETDVRLDGRRSTVRTQSSNVGELLASSLMAAGQNAPNFDGSAAQVAVQNGGGIRNDSIISAGVFTVADTFDIAPFANFVVTGDVPRERFKELLEVGVAGLPDAEGTFPQIAGFTLEVDPSQPPREVDDEGDCSLIGDEGSRIRTVTLDDGTEIVANGQVVAGPDITLATIDFLSNGGDCYPLADLDFTKVGVSYQQALSSYISQELGGEVNGDDYPEAGSRIVIEAGIAPSPDDADADDADSTAQDDEPGDEPAEELPNTGLESWLFLIVALTVAAGGALIVFEGRRAGWLSLTNRLNATQAWIPDPDPDDP